MANDVELFKGAKLPAGDIAKYKQALAKTQMDAPQIGGTPILKLGKDSVWRYGQKDTEVQDGSEWAINPVTLQKGYIAWADSGGNKPLGKKLVPVLQGIPVLEADLPDVGAEWMPQVAFDLQCLNGDDKGVTVQYTSSALGGIEAFHGVITQLMHQLEVDPNHLIPVVSLQATGYQHTNLKFGLKGWIAKPVFEVVGWLDAAGNPAGEEEQEPESEPEQPQKTAAAASPRRAAAPTTRRAPVSDGEKTAAAPEPMRRAPVNGAAPPRGPGRPRKAVEPTAEEATRDEQAAAAGQPADDEQPVEDLGPVTRRRRRAAVTA